MGIATPGGCTAGAGSVDAFAAASRAGAAACGRRLPADRHGAAAQPSPLLPPDSLPATPSQDQAVADDNAVAQDDQVDDYDTASLDQDSGGSDDDSWA